MSEAHATSVYAELSRAFNRGRTRAVLCGGQAVVLHRLAVMSKDGDWIVREDDECLAHILCVMDRCGAVYRFGAPFHPAWLSGGWSSHFEFTADGVRVRTDFFTRPPRIDGERLRAIWDRATGDVPFADAASLAEMKRTNREKDYVVIGELARLIRDPVEQLRFSRSARDLRALAAAYPTALAEAARSRPLLAVMPSLDEEALAAALDAERRRSIKENEARLMRYMNAAEKWREAWPEIEREIHGRPLLEAHDRILHHAESLLPKHVSGAESP